MAPAILTFANPDVRLNVKLDSGYADTRRLIWLLALRKRINDVNQSFVFSALDRVCAKPQLCAINGRPC